MQQCERAHKTESCRLTKHETRSNTLFLFTSVTHVQTSFWYTVTNPSQRTTTKMEQLSYIPVFQSIIINLQPRDLSNFVLSSRKFVRLTENTGVMEEYRKKYH